MVLTRKSLSLFPTQHGILFLGILIAMLLGSVNYNNNAGFVLVFLLGSMALISVFLSYRNLVGLRVNPGQPLPVFAGQTAFFPVEILAQEKGGQALSLYFEKREEAWPSARPGTGLRLEIPFETRARGIHCPKSLTLESVFPFGLFRLRAKLEVHTGVLVYPKPLAGAAFSELAGLDPDGEEETRFRGTDDFKGLTPYLPGSPVGRISWKTFSRGKGLFVKDFTAETGQDMVFSLDRVRGKDLERRLSRLCGAVVAARTQGLAYGLVLGKGQRREPGTGEAHMHQCLTALALFREPEEK